MESTQRLRARRPLASLGRRDRHALHRHSGMHSPNPDIRTDTDAFDIRPDVLVEDACLTSLRLVHMAVAQLNLLATSADLATAHRDAVDGIACLARLACGSIGLVDYALCNESPEVNPTEG